MQEEELKFPLEVQVALKFPRRRVRATEVHNVVDMNDTLLPVVEEMGRLNEHNFDETMQGELTLTDMGASVAFAIFHGAISIDVSEADTTLSGVSTIYNSQSWQAIHPDVLTVQGLSGKGFNSPEGGMYRLVASGQFVSTSTTTARLNAYGRFAFRVDSAVLPDSMIGDQDFAPEHETMELGYSGRYGSFLLDITIPLTPGPHTIEVVGETRFLARAYRDDELYIFSAECLVWEMAR